ncbi:FecR family protein [Aquirufa beregesia]
MTQHEFHILTGRYLSGNCSPEEENLLLQWLQSQPEKLDLDIKEGEKGMIEQRIWSNILLKIEPTKLKLSRSGIWAIGIAACFMCVLFFFNNQNIADQIAKNQSGIELKNTTTIDQKVVLEDGSKVILKPQSTLIFAKHFNVKQREVYLIGEAFFNVKRDISKPFIVHAGDLITEVLGTSFRIKSNESKNKIEVSVASGKVSVYTKKNSEINDRNGVILTRNQKVIYDMSSKNIIPTIVDNPQLNLASEVFKAELIFQSSPLLNVLSIMSRHYGVEIILTNPKSNECQFTADLNGLSMFTQLDLICKSIGATYEKRGTAIFITGEGCN